MQPEYKKEMLDFLREFRLKSVFDSSGRLITPEIFEKIGTIIEYIFNSVKLDKETCKKIFEIIPVEDYIHQQTTIEYKVKLNACLTSDVVKEFGKEALKDVCIEHLYQMLKSTLDNPKIIDELGKLRDRTMEIITTETIKPRTQKDAEALEHMRSLKTFCESRGTCDGCPFHVKDKFDSACIIGSPNVWTKEYALNEAAEERWKMNEDLDKFYGRGY